MKKSISIILLMVTVFLAVPRQTFAASLYLTPSSGTIAVGDEFTVSVLTDTEGATVNTAESNITFTSNTLELISVSQGSTFLLPAPASPNKSNSSAYFGGGLPNPGFAGKSGSLGTMTFKAKAAGKASINISRGSLLLNDGSGTRINASTAGASFTITLPPVGPVTVFSSSHSLQAWSKRNDVEFNWTMPDRAAGVSFSYDQNPNGVPDDTIDASTITSTSFQDTKDGTWYFHIKAKGKSANDPFGQITTYKVQIDTVAPLPFSINLLSETDQQNASDTPTIDYKATDATSGVYRYDVYLDNHLVKELSIPPLAFAKTQPGPHSIRVEAFDRAGNGTESVLPLNITLPGEQPVTMDYLRKYLQLPLYGLIGLNLLIFLIVFMLVRQSRKQNQVATVQAVQISALQGEIRNIIDFEVDLTRLKKQIDVRFMDMARSNGLRIDELRVDVAGKIENEIARNVNKLKTDISGKLAQARSFGAKQFQQMQRDIKDNIASEIARASQPVYMRGNSDDAKVKTEVLRRLYDEFMNNKI